MRAIQIRRIWRGQIHVADLQVSLREPTWYANVGRSHFTSTWKASDLTGERNGPCLCVSVPHRRGIELSIRRADEPVDAEQARRGPRDKLGRAEGPL